MQLLVLLYQVNDLAIHSCRIGSYALCYEIFLELSNCRIVNSIFVFYFLPDTSILKYVAIVNFTFL